MALFDRGSVADMLEDLLDRERQLVLSGNLDGLLRQAREKEHLMRRLSEDSRDQAHLVRLQQIAQRNQSLLVAAARGVKAARDRLGALHHQPRPFGTYGRTGARTELAGPASNINRRA